VETVLNTSKSSCPKTQHYINNLDNFKNQLVLIFTVFSNFRSPQLTMATTFQILNLPSELILSVAEHLDFPISVHLKLTCKHLNTLLRPLTRQQLLDAETTGFAYLRDILACRCCLRLRKVNEFSVRNRTFTKYRGGSDAHLRICQDCVDVSLQRVLGRLSDRESPASAFVT
jgi:hypothetical protein